MYLFVTVPAMTALHMFSGRMTLCWQIALPVYHALSMQYIEAVSVLCYVYSGCGKQQNLQLYFNTESAHLSLYHSSARGASYHCFL